MIDVYVQRNDSGLIVGVFAMPQDYVSEAKAEGSIEIAEFRAGMSGSSSPEGRLETFLDVNPDVRELLEPGGP
jgi:hypothetical protein